MPIENERKFVLYSKNLDAMLHTLKTMTDAVTIDLTQGYLPGDGRIRHIVYHEDSSDRFVFTYKVKVGGKTVEIETDISEHDYEKLSLIVREKLVKTRVMIKEPSTIGEHWDIDFFTNPLTGQIYFAMAEVELPEFIDVYNKIPVWLQDYVVYNVELGDKRFNSKNLTNPKKATKLLQDIMKKK